MTTRSGLTHQEWQTIKALFNREVAFPVSLVDRKIIRNCLSDLRGHFPKSSHRMQIVPVSTLEWSSTSFSFGEKRLALVDVEQANAISFLLSKALLFERPIFAYIEFMVRAAEAFYSMGRSGSALLVAKKANNNLRVYSRSQKNFPAVPRPMSPDEGVLKALTSGLVLSFVAGHEVGHLMRSTNGEKTDIECWVSETYEKHQIEPARHSEGQFERFLKPECVHKFDDKGQFCGDIILGIKYANRLDFIKSLMVGEAHSDVFGLIAMTEVAAKNAINPSVAASVVLGLLEFSEMLMAFRRLLPRLPVKGQTTNVTYEPTSLGFRRYMFVLALEAMRKGELPVPESISAYWGSLSEDIYQELFKVNSAGELNSVSNRSIHIARAALLVSSQGGLPEVPTADQIKEQYGPLAGSGFFLNSCLLVPEKWMRINDHNQWTPKPENETVPVGYGSAIHDISKIVSRPNLSKFADALIARHSDLKPDKILEAIRHPRSQVYARRLTGRWPHKIMKSL